MSAAPRSTSVKAQPLGGQREAILAEAAALFARSGYHGTSMSDLAAACGLSKATLYHHYHDKNEVLVQIADGRVSRLVDLCRSVETDSSINASDRLRVLIERFLDEYSNSQDSHRVLTEDVRFLRPSERDAILNKQRSVVKAFADAAAIRRPDLARRKLDKPIAMLLFGMLNWMFTWLRPDGELTHVTIAPVVIGLFFNGLDQMNVPSLPTGKAR